MNHSCENTGSLQNVSVENLQFSTETFWLVYEKLVFKLFPLVCSYVSIVMRAAFDDISVALVPLDFM